ncbi:MAG TPA: 30S ribosome-binding factor RbfA [Anaerolineae bacterium]|nr:30S ribosome-binding factor RbfA [Anaerolineae bacterium]HIP71007.1 30S ribosome-binding factor RbfA [Anaerolineae bacterium]
MSKIRQQRTAEQIRYIFSELFRRELSDPRLGGVTITEVTIDRELEHADIYVNALGDDGRQDEVIQALTGATGYLRRELSHRTRLRKAPQLHFHWDPRLAYAQEVDEILNSLDIPPAEDESPPDE